MDSVPRRSRGGGVFESLYKVLMRRNSVYVTFIIAGAFLGERVFPLSPFNSNKLWITEFTRSGSTITLGNDMKTFLY
ncbi:cytochrome b-c1 complex subunit 9-like isoform X1 [Glycine soja]|uniref:cytochrome b-c1 complex subunit 9, mitochondrial isoform X1 n=1 Tax=Glycine max TaxID=3847 RepID=UPI0007193D86|nr:cytochrome b-c1 complex subunit 9, mitochondrial isoform X1 [Glycine max]XP_028187754.1 cytochrome b-c1 complex subunit 9-like isoform X1 [Glycine soja]|eukprot:XP_014621053.1 cytochrome b-c1 complex subunit 9 isoform X1 [Glycine max]